MLDKSSIDLFRLRKDLRESSEASIAVKKQLRVSWTRPMAEEQTKHAELRRWITQLCVLRAYLRGKHHFRTPPHDGRDPRQPWDPEPYHARIAERTARHYTIEKPNVAAV
jgi:hypothetical protein